MALSMTACTSNPAEKETEAAAPADTEAAEEGEEKEAAADGDLITVGYAQVGAESDWRTANTESFKSTFTEENGYKLIFDDAQQKQENQIKAIRSFIQQGVDYIVVAPVVETGWETVLEEAKEAGIPVILSDRQMQLSEDSLYEAWVGGNFVKEGETCGDWLAKYLEDHGLESCLYRVKTYNDDVALRTTGLASCLDSIDGAKCLVIILTNNNVDVIIAL